MKKVTITLTKVDRTDLIEALHLHATKERSDRNRSYILAKELQTISTYFGDQHTTIEVKLPTLDLMARAVNTLSQIDGQEAKIVASLKHRLTSYIRAEAN